jgi:sugar transferase (PEP-CTERM system associated)
MAFERAPGKPFNSGAETPRGTSTLAGTPVPTDEGAGLDPDTENARKSYARANAQHRAVEPNAAVADSPDTRRWHPHRYVPDAGFVQMLLDILFIGAALAAIFPTALRQYGVTSTEQVSSVVAVMLLSNFVLLYASGCYRRDALLNSAVTRARLPITLGLGTLVFCLALRYGLAAAFPATGFFLSFSTTGVLALVGAGVVLGATTASRYGFFALVRAGVFHRRVIVIGTGERALYLHQHIGQSASRLANDLRFVPESVLDGRATAAPSMLGDFLVEPGSRSIGALARDLRADEIVIAADDRRGLSMESLLDCKAHGLPVTEFTAFFEREAARVDLRWLNPSWLVYSNGFQTREVDMLLKRAVDIAGSLLLLLVSAPVLTCAVVAVALEGRGSIFYSQTRVTRGGRHFELYKLRTMRSDAEIMGPQWAVENDPRITRTGRILRRTRIDEIPQLWNVLRGDMSLVGPRPERPVFVEQISKQFPLYHLRHKVKAGLTGWAQINFTYGASMADAERKLEYDLYYVKNYSLLRDILILLQTFWVLIWPQGVR